MPEAAAKPKGRGGGLTRKLGPLPLWAWAAIAAAIAAVLYLRSRGSVSEPGSSPYGGAVETVTGANGGTAYDAAMAGAPQANYAPQDSLSPDVLASLADYRGSLRDTVLGAFDEGNADLGNLLASYGGTQTASSSYGAAGAPPITVNLVGAGASSPAKPATKKLPAKTTSASKSAASKPSTAAKQPGKVPAKQAPPSTRYYTYKTDVKVGKGQTLKFRAGKGYYAA